MGIIQTQHWQKERKRGEGDREREGELKLLRKGLEEHYINEGKWKVFSLKSLAILIKNGVWPHLGRTVELALVAWVQKSRPWWCEGGELPYPLPAATGRRASPAPHLNKEGRWPWWCRCRRSGELTNSPMAQAQKQGFELGHPILSPI